MSVSGTSTPARVLLTVRELEVTIGSRAVLRGVGLELQYGERVALVGPSGSGKSLTAAAVLGRLPAVATGRGSVELAGEQVLSVPAARRSRRVRVTAVGQDSRVALNPLVPVGSQMRAAVRACGADLSPADLARELAATGLDEPERVLAGLPGELSGGQRQRVQLAMALAGRPDLLVADEPTTALDPVNRRRVLDVLTERLTGSATALLFISHDLDAAREVCSRAVHLAGGTPVDPPAADPATSGATAVGAGRRTCHVIGSHSPAARRGPGVPEDPLLQAHDLHRFHPDPRPWRPWRRHCAPVRALDGVDLALGAGERVGLAGPSGAGKSSLLRILLGLDRPDRGAVTVAGRPIGAGPVRAQRWFRRTVQYVPQDPATSLNPRMTVHDLVAEPLHRLDVPGDPAAAVRAALDRVGLAAGLAGRRPGELSGGQAQRAALARALVVRPRLLLADEPVGGLDPVLRDHVVDLLDTTCERSGAGLLLIAHDLDVLGALCSRLVVLHAGRVVEDGPTADVTARPGHPVTAELVEASGLGPPVPVTAP
ncbi:peptide/nickel transport system ATP-binding protein [Pseudonocardia ammonioxydans]|uniref:Peptide/nickel transport system ATP-binding protein n=1 Tax=Pseudonocardia ammonioxydans TaxID=260086 RepID=A0A1I4XZP5_PSUAM|nr:ATP-binding cassette domain-containing protein [Pseudonocardia ammonioxydans]SFN31294.1 peptide/nickel transport system ATP-binding protein [Pseudonocardia ammonioxydans]